MPAIQCRFCYSPTADPGTKMCDNCWEAERRLGNMPYATVLKILQSAHPAAGNALSVVHALLVAMDQWGDEEDGINPEAFEAYEAGRAFIGQTLPPNPDGLDDLAYQHTQLLETHG